MGYRSFRRAAGLALALTTATTALGCGGVAEPLAPEPEPTLVLTGEWERFNSTFTVLNGMVVTVNSDQTEATIAQTPGNPYGFVAGDLKWKNVVRISDGEYVFDDLVRETNGTQHYVEGRILVLRDNRELSITFPNTTNTFQQWRRPP